MVSEDYIRKSIDNISESVRINGCETEVTEFLINFLTGNIPMIADMIAEKEADDELMRANED
jgi:hypothetical protein